MASQIWNIGKVVMFLLLLILLATNVIAKRSKLAASNGEKMGIIKGEKVKMKGPDKPWEPGTGG